MITSLRRAKDMVSSFEELGLGQWIVETCKALNIMKPTPCQVACIPQTLNGKDIIGSSETGTGKTMSFVLPIVDKLSVDPCGVFAIVLTPTRELAFQIYDQFKAIGNPMSIRVAVVVGGLESIRQATELENRPHVVVATPGRLADLFTIEDSVERFHLHSIRFLVLDEADRLLEDGFASSLSTILDVLPVNRQTLVYSATMNDKMEQLSKTCRSECFIYTSSSSRYSQVRELEQFYLLIPFQMKTCYLAYLLLYGFPSFSCIIFTGSCKRCQHLFLTLEYLGLNVGVLHSKMKQMERLKAIHNIQRGTIRILICTDVASRGLDIPQVELVVNYHIPSKPSTYIHRVGRTARAGNRGKAISLVSQFEVEIFRNIERRLERELVEFGHCKEKEVLKILTDVLKAERKAKLKMLGMKV
ncbi:Probable ATP-dependent RNA helicase DDX49 [Galdieria sulphuraria]|uniref:ATP-dependent RNA helicase n=1 Tax=Galdieria sulphuraria TaxID=130081 RepID=M2WSD1_GALSU|nr:ATP-dependent RNA helicase [Galdieria sulphuraria]EME26765.1 ATP-dependent RNA helicase [Galdieria sulphuraria]GJD07038.1 Probable ATP-dependent RNA helicase DDX49 [Galdieria sulphuraria]|eukprot:XP_005703285.1 ATP-dependent RNA helicase [Galdieria sulphuraria]